MLAGFEDGRVDEGPAASGASLAGLEIANERGWAAPSSEAGAASPDESKTEAAAEADTSRAESETVAEESEADVEGGAT